MVRRVCVVVLLLLAGVAVWAQDAKMFEYPEQLAPLKLDTAGSKKWSATVTKLAPDFGIAYPGDVVTLEISLKNTDTVPLAVTPTVDVTRINMQFEGYDFTRGDPMIGGTKISITPATPGMRTPLAAVTVAPNATVKLLWSLPKASDCAAYGAYAVIVDLGEKGRQAAGTFARVHPPNPAAGDGKSSPLLYSMFWQWPIDQQCALLARLGYKWVRTDGSPNWASASQQDVYAPFDWTREDAWIKPFRDNHLWILSNMYGSPGQTVTQPNQKAYNVIHEEKYDERMGEFVEGAVKRYCGEDGNGPLQTIDYYNEPWEGGGISGWKSDSVRYRKLYETIYERAHKASKFIKVGGASSIMNTVDKFFIIPDWRKQYGMDVLTDHYVQPYCCFGPRVADTLKLPSIETETWIGNTPDSLIATATHFTAAGQQQVNPNHPSQLIWGGNGSGPMCTPAVVAANYFLYFIAGKHFSRVVFLDHLPWLYEWTDGKTTNYILAGDRHLLNDQAVTMYDQIRADGTLELDSLKGKLKATDAFGNLYPLKKGKYLLPCSYTSVYLDAPGLDPAKVIDAVSKAKMTGVKPVEIFADDFTAPINKAKTVDVTLHNVLNRAVSGTLTFTPPASIKLTTAMLAVTLAAGEEKRFSLPIAGATVNPANAYEFTYAFKGDAGSATLKEVLHVNTLTKGTPTIDGDLSDWNDAVPVITFGQDLKRDLAERAWRPWEQEKDVTKGLTEVRLKWDATNLYIAVRDRNKDWSTKPRLSTRKDDDYFGTGDMAHTYVKDMWDALPFTGSCVQVGIGLGLHKAGFGPATTAPARMLADDDTDYEYDFWGAPDGGLEIWRSSKPGTELFNFLPRCMPVGYDGVPKGAKGVVKRVGNDTVYEVAIPLADMPELHPAAGGTIHLTFALPGSGVQFGAGRSRTRSNGLTLKPTWQPTPSNDIAWGFVE